MTLNEQAAGTTSWKGFLDSMVWGCVLPDTRTWCRELFSTHGAQDDVINVLSNFWDHQDLPGITPRSEGIEPQQTNGNLALDTACARLRSMHTALSIQRPLPQGPMDE